MIGMLAHRTLGDRPRRTAMLLLGLGIAVGVMITLLAIGQAVLVRAEDKDLVGGGDLLLLPAGIDVEVMKIGGSTGMFAMLDNARFLFRQLLSGPRFAGTIARVTPDGAALPLAAASPALVEKVVYVRKVGRRPGTGSGRTAVAADSFAQVRSAHTKASGVRRRRRDDDRTLAAVKALAHGFIPSLDVAAGGPTAALPRQGIPWRDHHADRMWIDPPVDSLYNDMDRFHLPARTLPNLERWAEWLYFNFTDDDAGIFGYVSLIVGGDIEAGQGRGGPLLQIQRRGQKPLKFTIEVPVRRDDISLARVDLRLGALAAVTFRDGAYRLHLEWDDPRGPVRADLVVRPVLDFYYPPVLIHDSDSFVSGYTVPALRTAVSGTIQAPGVAITLHDVPGYHDHNWGTWRSVSWEWGTASSSEYALLYGRVQHPDIDPGRSSAGIFALLAQARSATQRGGTLGLFRPRQILYDWQEPGAAALDVRGTPPAAVAPPGATSRTRAGATAAGGPARVPLRLSMTAAPEPSAAPAAMQAQDEITATLDVHAVAATPPRLGEDLVFLQLQGLYSVQARIAGRDVGFEAPGFAEVFVSPRVPTGPSAGEAARNGGLPRP